MVEYTRSLTWVPLSLKLFPKVLADKLSRVIKEYIKAHSERRVRERI